MTESEAFEKIQNASLHLMGLSNAIGTGNSEAHDAVITADCALQEYLAQRARMESERARQYAVIVPKQEG